MVGNSHIDDVWLWTWPEGMAAVVSAFRSVPELEKAVALDPHNAGFHYQSGQAYLKSGRREEGAKALAAAQKILAAARDKQAEELSGKLPLPPIPR